MFVTELYADALREGIARPRQTREPLGMLFKERRSVHEPQALAPQGRLSRMPGSASVVPKSVRRVITCGVAIVRVSLWRQSA